MYCAWLKFFSILTIFSMMLSTACTSGQVEQAKASVEPKYGGTLTVAVDRDPTSLDPHTQDDVVGLEFVQLVYSGLVQYAPGTSNLEIVPDIAERWEQSDELTYIFYLRKGVKFQNLPPVNGRELTSDDVKYSLERIATPNSKFVRRYALEAISKIETPDRYSIKITIKSPSASFLNYIASAWTAVVPKEVVERDGDLAKTAIGSGPFILDTYTRTVSATFKKNPDFFGKGKPYVDAVKILIMPDADARLAALKAKQVDIAEIGSADIDSLTQGNQAVIIDRQPDWSATRLYFGLAEPPFNDSRVRQAVQAAIDNEQLVKQVLDGQGQRNIGAIPWSFSDYALPISETVAFDQGKAKRLLAEAGYQTGFKAELITTARLGTVASALKDQLQSIGIDVEVKQLDPALFAKRKAAFDYDLAVDSSPPYDDPEEYLFPYFSSKGTQYNYRSPRVDLLLIMQHRATESADRKKTLQEIQKLLYQDAAAVDLYSRWKLMAHQPYVNGYKPFCTSYFHFENVWLDRS